MSSKFTPPPDMTVNRQGVTTEYKRGTFYLSHTVWEDGHEEVEVHQCEPVQLYHQYDASEAHLLPPQKVAHTCDVAQFEEVFSKFSQLKGEEFDFGEGRLLTDGTRTEAGPEQPT